MSFIPSPSLMHNLLVAQWTLRAWKRADEAGDAPTARALLDLFDPRTLEHHLEGPDPILASGLLHRLPSSVLAPMAPLLLERWRDWDATRAGWATEALARVAPERALPSFLAWVRTAHPVYDASRLEGVARAAVAMGAAGAELARAILARCSDPGGIPLADDVAVRLAVHAGPSWAAALIGYRLRERAEDPGGVHPEDILLDIVAAAFSAATDGSPLLELLVDLAHHGREHTPLLLGPLFIDPIRAEEALKLLVRPGRRRLRGLERMLSKVTTRRSPVLDIAAGLAEGLIREAEREALLVEPLRLFLAAALLSPEIDPDPDLTKLSTPQLVSLAALDIRELPHESRLVRALAELDPEKREPLLGEFFHLRHQRPAAARFVRAMGLAGDPDLAPNLIDLGLGSEDDTVREASERALIRIGQPAVQALIDAWDSLEGAQLYSAWSVLQSVGGAAAIEHLIERWPAEKGDLILLESLCETASAQPDPRLVELLERDLPREAACVEEAWVVLCLLLGLERPGLDELRTRLEERRARAYTGIRAMLGGGDAAPLDPGEMRLVLACGSCGEQNTFEVTALWIDPASPTSRPHIGDDLRCPSCGGEGPFDLASMGNLAIMAELARMQTADGDGKEYPGPFHLLTTTTMEGWSGSPGSSPPLSRSSRTSATTRTSSCGSSAR